MIGVALMALAVAQGAEGPKVLYRRGETRPIIDMIVDEETRRQNEAACKVEARQPVAFDQSAVYPVRSPSLRLGQVAERSRIGAEMSRRVGMRPVFLIGDDPASHRWLAGNKEALAQMGATGVLVQVENRARFEAVAAIAPDLPIFAASGEPFAEELGIDAYPVLVNTDGAHQ